MTESFAQKGTGSELIWANPLCFWLVWNVNGTKGGWFYKNTLSILGILLETCGAVERNVENYCKCKNSTQELCEIPGHC